VSAKFRQNSNDFYYDALFNTDVTIAPRINVFGFAEVQKDTILKIDDRFDLGLGASYLLFPNLFAKNKISYAIMLIGYQVNHSFRYKLFYESLLFDSNFYISYITPLNELSSKFEFIVKAIDLFGIGYNIEYRTNNYNQDYIQNVFLKLNFK
jgi:hypothetical protein